MLHSLESQQSFSWLPSSEVQVLCIVQMRKLPLREMTGSRSQVAKYRARSAQYLPSKWLKQGFSMCGPQDSQKAREVKTIAMSSLSPYHTVKFPQPKCCAMTSSSPDD